MHSPAILCADALDALLDDLNTPKAFAALHELRGEAAKGVQAGRRLPEGERAIARSVADAGGRWRHSVRHSLGDRRKQGREPDRRPRNAARKAKDFKESDRIRDELAAMGVVLKDSKDGTTWEIAR